VVTKVCSHCLRGFFSLCHCQGLFTYCSTKNDIGLLRLSYLFDIIFVAIQSRPIVQVIERPSFDLHQGQNKTQICPSHSSLQMCAHPNHRIHRLHQMDFHLQIESKKGENEPKQKKLQTKQLKSFKNFPKK